MLKAQQAVALWNGNLILQVVTQELPSDQLIRVLMATIEHDFMIIYSRAG